MGFHLKNIGEYLKNKEWRKLLSYIYYWFVVCKMKRTRIWAKRFFRFFLSHKLLCFIQLPIFVVVLISDKNYLYWLLDYEWLSPYLYKAKPLISLLLDNAIVFNLGIGYTISLIFYYLVVYRREVESINRSKPLLKSLLAETITGINDLIEILSNEFQMQNNNASYVSLKNFNKEELKIAFESINSLQNVNPRNNVIRNRHLMQGVSIKDYLRNYLELSNFKIRSSSAVVLANDNELFEIMNKLNSIEEMYKMSAYSPFAGDSFKRCYHLVYDLKQVEKSLLAHYTDYYG